jgi:hypothetical protein
MNKKLLLLIGVFCFFWTTTKAQTENQKEVLTECLSLNKVLRNSTPRNYLNSPVIFVVNKNNDFDFYQNFMVNEKEVRLIDETNCSKCLDFGYFLFDSFNVDNLTAKANYSFVYAKDGSEHKISMSVDLEKKKAGWVIVNYKL